MNILVTDHWTGVTTALPEIKKGKLERTGEAASICIIPPYFEEKILTA